MSFTKLKFQYQYFIIYLSIILVFWIDKLNAQDGFCSSPELTDNDWIFGISNERISATFEGGTLSELQMENILRINHTVLDNDNQHLYIDARLLENQILELYTTDFFHQYEENEDNLFMQLTIVFVCTNGATRSIFIRQDLLDENNHDPIFSLEQYSIVLPLPLPSGYEITLYQEIFTRDIDVNQNQITFTIEGTDLLTPRTIRGTQTNKISYLSLILNNQLLTIKESIDIIITATDNGQLLSRSTSANVTITGNSTVSFIPSPKFEKLIYKGNLYDNEQRTFDIESIILDMETFENGNVEFISNDMPNYFELNADTNTIEIVELPDGDLQEADFNGINYLTFQIDAIRNDEIGSTLIIFDIQRENLENITIPNFIQPIFIGNLTYEFEIMFPVAITLNEDIAENDIFIEFTGIDSDWFTIGNITNDIIYIEINATSLSLIENEIENREYFLFEIIATKMITQMTGSTVIMINTPKRSFGPQPQFEQSYYVATLNDNLQLNAINIVIIESTYTEDIEISKDPNSDPNNLFDVIQIENSIQISAQLTSDDIEEGRTQFIIPIVAFNRIEFNGQSTTILLINVPASDEPEPLPIPIFEQSIYEGQLYENNSIILNNSMRISLTSDTYGSDIDFSIESEDTIGITVEENINSVTLHLNNVNNEFDDELLYLTCKIVATRRLTEVTGFALVIIQLPIKTIAIVPIPTFTQTIFEGYLNENDQLMHDVISLVQDTYSDAIDFMLIDGDAEYLDLNHIENNIQITLKSEYNIDYFEGKNYLLSTIVATVINNNTNDDAIESKGVAFIIFDITRNITEIPSIIPTFTNRYYIGTLNADLTQIDIESIDLIDDVSSDNVIFKIEESDDAGLFDYSLENNAIRITLNRTLTSNDIDGKINFVFILTASNSIGNSDRTIIIVNVPEINCEEILQFQNTHYNFWITQNDIGEIGRVSIKSSSTINVLYYLELNGYLESRLSINPETGVIITTNAITIGQHEFVVIARNGEDETAASVMLEIMEDVQCPNPNNTIENMLLIRNLDEETEHLEILPVLVNDCIYQIQRMEPNDEEYFKIDRQTNQLTSIKIDRESNSFGTMAVPQIQITLKLLCGEDIPAEDEDDNEIETQIPDLDNDNNEELIPDDDEEEAVDNDIENNNNDDDDIENNNDDGDDVHDNEVEDNEDDINVQVPENNEDDVDVQLPENNEDDVDVQVPENNEDNVDVQIPENNEENVDVQIPENNEDDVDVQVPENNDDGNDVEQMPENNENIDDLDMENVEDNENRPENIDDIENDVQVPQPSPPPPPLPSPSSIENEIIVENKIKKNISKRSVKPKANQNLIKYINPNFDNRWFILTNGIPHHTDTTMLTVILNDINDNAPEFINPPIQPYLMGYPEPHIAERILIPYLIKCEVIDKDFGLNAQILYGLENNDHFEINSETGIIVPTQNAMTKINEIELIVHAHDRNGQSDGHRTDTNIIIKKLQAAHITVLTVSGDTNENVLESVLVHIRSETQLNIMVLHSSFISTNDPTTRQLFENQRANGQTTVLRIILYAFNDLGELLDTDQLQSALHTINSEYKIASYHDVLGSAVTDINDLVMIIVIAVLSVIFVVTAVGAFLMWWFLIRPYEYRKILETSSNASTADLKKEFGDSSPPPPERINRMNVYEDNEKRDSFNISGNTIGDTTDNENALEKVIDSNNIYNNKNYNKFNDANDDEDEYGRSKQNYKYGGNDTINNNNNNDNDENDKRDRMSQKVTFNELVERIDIETAVRDSDDEIRI